VGKCFTKDADKLISKRIYKMPSISKLTENDVHLYSRCKVWNFVPHFY